MSVSYNNYYGQLMATSASPQHWYQTTVMGQTLVGGVGPEQISDQLGGSPTLIGGTGDTTFDVGWSSVNVVQPIGGGVDTIVSWATYTLPTNVSNLTLMSDRTTGIGNAAANLMIAQGASDTLIAGTGNDVMVDAGGGGEFFSFGATAGHDVIYGFQASGATHDLIQLTSPTLTTFAQVQAHLTQDGADALLSLSSSEAILIRNTQVSALTAADFALDLNLGSAKPSFDGEFNTPLSLYNPATGTGTWKTNYVTGYQGNGPEGWSSRNLSQGEQQIYVDPNYAGTASAPLGLNPFSIVNGVLTITASRTPTADLPYLDNLPFTSGLLTTQTSFAQTYGYFEIKAQLPAGQGVWPAFWLLPTNGTWPPEVDVFEQLGGADIYQTSHYTDSTGAPAQTGFTTYQPGNTTGFHTYGLLWTKTSLTWYVDGVETATTATPADMNSPMYMLVNLGIGGWSGDAPSSLTSAQMEVDYVKAYSLASLGALAPTGRADSYTIKAGGVLTETAAAGVLANDTDNNSMALSAALGTGPSHGTLSLNADGSFTYTPTAGFAGTDSFTYVPNDALTNGAATTVTIKVTATAPTEKADSYATLASHALTTTAATGVLANDTDNNGLTLTAALASGGAPAHGTLVLNQNGSFTYTPTEGYTGTDSFKYVASDSLSTGAATTVTLTVSPVPVSSASVAGSSYVAGSATDHNSGSADTIDSAFSYSLVGLPAHNLVLTGAANLTGTANGLGDTLTANTGNDTFVAGSGIDTIVFGLHSGHDVISGFSGHDVIDVSALEHAGYHPTLVQTGANAFINFANGVSIELLGVHTTSLVATSVGFMF
jgi:VCBS repeat-containing protein